MRATLLAAALALTAPTLAFADGPTAVEIVRTAQEHGTNNMLDLKAEVTLTSTDKSGALQKKQVLMASKKVDGKLRSIVRFRSPADVAGIALLVVEGGKGEGDKLTLYLPAYHRTRPIAAAQRGTSFGKTDFSYADFSRGGGTVKETAAKRLPDQKLLGRDAYGVEGPAEEGSPYATVRAWFDVKSWLPLKFQMLDSDGSVVKTYTVLKVGEHAGRTLADEAVMEDHRAGSRTTVTLDKVEGGAPADEAFTERGLERG